MGEWGDMSIVTDAPNLFRRSNELLWVWFDKSDNKLSQMHIDFAPMLLIVFDHIVLRGAFHKGVQSIEIKENFSTQYNPTISVMHIGERIPLNESGPSDYLLFLVNMISKFPPSFYEIEINDGEAAVMYKQVFTEVSGRLCREQFTTAVSQDTMNWTKVTFKPHLGIFNIHNDVLNVGCIIWKRAVDIAGTLVHLNVTLSAHDFNFENFAEYVDRWYPQFVLEKRSDAPKRAHEKLTKGNHKWEVSIGRSHGHFEHVSFINGSPTHKGGPHVELVKKTLTQYAMEIEKKHRVGFDIDDLCLFINLTINDDFRPIEFPTNYKLEFSTDFVEKFTEILKGLGPVKLSEYIPNLTDATDAGGENADKCWLVLTVGDSAKTFALIGHGDLGRQFYGLLPIRGKIPNAKRNDSNILAHEVVKSIVASLGLEKGACYSSVKKLRYGHLLLMMDQDHDGSHIKGLLINLIHTFWPSLLKISFVSQFVTPIIKVKTNTDFLEFYSLPEYNIWAKNRFDKLVSADQVRYYKGLASHDPDDVIEYISNKLRHVKTFKYSGLQDFNAINLAFSENRVCDRRQWIMTFEEGTFLDLTAESITYSDFFNKEFILYSIENIKQSIPSMVDGLKPSQRKALFTAIKTGLTIEKVDTLAGSVYKECEYHHGHANMTDTVVGMAQTHVGSNNISLFSPKGIFGSRLKETKSDARYLSVMLSPLMKYIFRQEDEALLSYQVEEGKQVQPDWFLPVIPMVLVNGCEGITTGWNTKITKYHPMEIIQNLKKLLTGNESEYEQLFPWFKGFLGKVEKQEGCEGSYTVNGAFTEDEESLKVQIHELPVETKVDKFKADLDLLKTKEKIKSYEEQHRKDNIQFVVAFTEDQFKAAKKGGFKQLFKLFGTITTDNMHLIDERGLLMKYSSADEVLTSFYSLRLQFYGKRKVWLSQQCKAKVKKLENIKNYIKDYNKDRFSKKLNMRMKQFQEFGYDSIDDYQYLRKLSLDDLDEDNIPGIDIECNLRKEELTELEGATASDLWMADLEALEQNLNLFFQGKLTDDQEFRPHKKQRTGP